MCISALPWHTNCCITGSWRSMRWPRRSGSAIQPAPSRPSRTSSRYAATRVINPIKNKGNPEVTPNSYYLKVSFDICQESQRLDWTFLDSEHQPVKPATGLETGQFVFDDHD